MVLENQLFAPPLKGVIDFDFVELTAQCGVRFFAPLPAGRQALWTGANEEPERSGARRSQNQ
jgi:hypothetical protein